MSTMKRLLVASLSEAVGKMNDEHTKWRHPECYLFPQCFFLNNYAFRDFMIFLLLCEIILEERFDKC